MRDIRFRAWYKPKGKMYSGSLESMNFETKVLGVYTVKNGYQQLRMSDFEIMQFIGLYDKNGKEIFEGDILRDQDGHIGEVKWIQEHCAFLRFIPEPSGYYLIESGNAEDSELEVIGNIYQDYELLGRE
jgi:uncharacterized phage protein (TIGR01671 family)